MKKLLLLSAFCFPLCLFGQPSGGGTAGVARITSTDHTVTLNPSTGLGQVDLHVSPNTNAPVISSNATVINPGILGITGGEIRIPTTSTNPVYAGPLIFDIYGPNTNAEATGVGDDGVGHRFISFNSATNGCKLVVQATDDNRILAVNFGQTASNAFSPTAYNVACGTEFFSNHFYVVVTYWTNGDIHPNAASNAVIVFDTNGYAESIHQLGFQPRTVQCIMHLTNGTFAIGFYGSTNNAWYTNDLWACQNLPVFDDVTFSTNGLEPLHINNLSSGLPYFGLALNPVDNNTFYIMLQPEPYINPAQKDEYGTLATMYNWLWKVETNGYMWPVVATYNTNEFSTNYARQPFFESQGSICFWSNNPNVIYQLRNWSDPTETVNTNSVMGWSLSATNGDIVLNRTGFVSIPYPLFASNAVLSGHQVNSHQYRLYRKDGIPWGSWEPASDGETESHINVPNGGYFDFYDQATPGPYLRFAPNFKGGYVFASGEIDAPIHTNENTGQGFCANGFYGDGSHLYNLPGGSSVSGVTVVLASGADDTAAIQTALNSKGHVLLASSNSIYTISNALIITSNTWLEVARGATIYESSNHNVVMLRTPTVTSNLLYSNVKVSGGVWDNNWAGNPGLDLYASGQNFLQWTNNTNFTVKGASGTLAFFGCSNLVLEDLTIVDPNHFGVQVGGSVNVAETRIHFQRSAATISDGLHCNGPLNGLTINNCDGNTGDDFVALNAWDWDLSSPFTNGANIVNVSIRDLNIPYCVWSPVKMSVAANAGVAHVAIENVRGTSANNGFIWWTGPDSLNPAHTNAVGNIEDVDVNNFSWTVTNSATNGSDIYGEGCYLRCNAYGVSFRGVEISPTIGQFASQPWLRIGSNSLTIPTIQMSDVRLSRFPANLFTNGGNTTTEFYFDHNAYLQLYDATQSPGAGATTALNGASVNATNNWTSAMMKWGGSTMSVTSLVTGTINVVNNSLVISPSSGVNWVALYKNGIIADYIGRNDGMNGNGYGLHGQSVCEKCQPGDVWTVYVNLAGGTITPNVLFTIYP